MRFRFATVCALAAGIGMLALPAVGARAGTVSTLPPLSYVHQVLVDDSAGYVFISEGYFSSSLQTTGGGIVVTDLAGTYVTTLDSGHAAEGMAIRGGTLYAALDADQAVAAIDTATIRNPTPTQTLISLGNSSYLPYDLALQSGKLWVSYGGTSGGFGGVGDIDLTASHPMFTPNVLTGTSFYYAPDLAADPKDDGDLGAAVPDQSAVPLATFFVAGSSPVLLAQSSPIHFNDCPSSELGDAMTAGGGTLLVLCDGYPSPLAFTTTTLAPAGSYGTLPGSPFASAVAVAPDGAVAVSASGGPSPGVTDIATFTSGGVALNTYEYGFSPSAMTNGLAWSSNSTRLYAVLVSYTNGNPASATYSLQVIENAVAPALTLTGTSRVNYGAPITLSGTVTTGTVAPPAGSEVTISRTRSGSTSTTHFAAFTAASGAFSFTDKTRPIPDHYSYTASYNGTASPAIRVTISPLAATVAMRLRGFFGSAKHGSSVYRLYHHAAKVRAAVTVTPTRPGECVRLQVQEYYHGQWRARGSTPCAALGKTSKVTASLAARRLARGHPYRIRAVFIPGRDTTVHRADSGWHYLMIEK